MGFQPRPAAGRFVFCRSKCQHTAGACNTARGGQLGTCGCACIGPGEQAIPGACCSAHTPDNNNFSANFISGSGHARERVTRRCVAPAAARSNRSRFVADFVGSANLIKGKPAGEGLFEAEGGVILKVFAPHRPHGRETEVAVRTAYVEFEPRAGDNQVPGKVRQRLFHGDFVQYVIDSGVGPLIVRRPPINLLEEGAPVTVSFSPENCVLLEG